MAFNRIIFLRWTLLAAALFGGIRGKAAESPHRANLVEALLAEDESKQVEIIRGLAESGDPLVQQALAAWRQGGVFIHETNEIRTPFLTESQTDSAGRVHAIRIADGDSDRR